MKTFGVVPLRFGRAAPERVDTTIDLFYQDIALACGIVPAERVNISQLTLPLSYEMLADAVLAFGMLSEYSETWLDKTDLIIFDLTNPVDQPIRQVKDN